MVSSVLILSCFLPMQKFATNDIIHALVDAAFYRFKFFSVARWSGSLKWCWQHVSKNSIRRVLDSFSNEKIHRLCNILGINYATLGSENLFYLKKFLMIDM